MKQLERGDRTDTVDSLRIAQRRINDAIVAAGGAPVVTAVHAVKRADTKSARPRKDGTR